MVGEALAGPCVGSLSLGRIAELDAAACAFCARVAQASLAEHTVKVGAKVRAKVRAKVGVKVRAKVRVKVGGVPREALGSCRP